MQIGRWLVHGPSQEASDWGSRRQGVRARMLSFSTAQQLPRPDWILHPASRTFSSSYNEETDGQGDSMADLQDSV